MKNNKRGKLVVIDGIDGSGKSSIAKELDKYFDENVIVKETFSDQKIIEELDKIAQSFNLKKEQLFSERLINIVWMIELMLNVKNSIEKELENGKNFILVRYILSAKVYSLATTNDDISQLFDIYSLLPQPDLGLYINVQVEEAVNRINRRGEVPKYYENSLYLQKISSKYKELLHLEPYPIIEINGNKSMTEIMKTLIEKLSFLK